MLFRSHLLKDLFGKVYIPKAVENELLRINALKIDIHSLLEESWLETRRIENRTGINELLKYLDQGESEAIMLSKSLHCDLLLMDENKGRKLAKSIGIKVIGLIGIIVLSKEKGLIKKIKPYIDELRNEYGFWIKEELYLQILESVNE